MKREIKMIGLLFILGIMLIACSGDDDLEKDKIPPTKPILIPHLGDTGDGQFTYNNNTFVLNDTNNGIDAESGERGFRLMWDPLIYDNDLEKIIINRYMNGDLENIVKVDSIFADNVYYIDNSIVSDFLYESKFSYFLDVYDRAGNSTRSDTVHYRLADKTYLISPLNGEGLANSNNLIFDWNYTGNYDFFRVLLFDEDDNLIWLRDIYADVNEDETVDPSSARYLGNSLITGNYYWRVDVFKFDFELDSYYNLDKDFYYGSESEISEFSIGNNNN